MALEGFDWSTRPLRKKVRTIEVLPFVQGDIVTLNWYAKPVKCVVWTDYPSMRENQYKNCVVLSGTPGRNMWSPPSTRQSPEFIGEYLVVEMSVKRQQECANDEPKAASIVTPEEMSKYLRLVSATPKDILAWQKEKFPGWNDDEGEVVRTRAVPEGQADEVFPDEDEDEMF